MLDKSINFGEQRLRYKLETWKKMGGFDILNNISYHITLVQLMDSLGDVNHALSVVGKCNFYSNHGKSLAVEY